MEKILCPKCGLPMRKVAVSATLPNGKKKVVYTCPNKAACGAICTRFE